MIWYLVVMVVSLLLGRLMHQLDLRYQKAVAAAWRKIATDQGKTITKQREIINQLQHEREHYAD